MDFSLIEHHPWQTGGIVIGGGLLLWLAIRGRSGSAVQQSGSDSGYAVSPASDATNQLSAQLSAQTTQAQTYITGLQLQGATQISLAQIGAGVANNQTAASLDVTDTQTAAQLALGLGTLSAGVQQAQISANLQSRYIDAIVAAFGGRPSNPSAVASPIVAATPYSPNPTAQIPASAPVNVPVQNYRTPATVGSVNPLTAPPTDTRSGDVPSPGPYDASKTYRGPYASNVYNYDVQNYLGGQAYSSLNTAQLGWV